MNQINCLGCGSNDCRFIFSLGEMPPVNAFKHINQQEENFPLDLFFCQSCSLVQLGTIVPPEKLFANYLHQSSASIGNLRHLKEVSNLLHNLGLISKKRVLEIGSNDGSLLEMLKNFDANVIGIDPAQNLEEISTSKGVKTLVGFFNEHFAENLKRQGLTFDTIIALNVIAHTPTFMSALRGIKRLLDVNGIFFMENAYILDTVIEGQFDTIYHEHVFCFSMHSLVHAYSLVGLKAVDAEIIPTQGKSIRVFVKHSTDPSPPSQRLLSILKNERANGVDKIEKFNSISNKITIFKNTFWEYLNKYKSEKFIGLGAPARGVVILNTCSINNEMIEFIVDDTKLKHGKFIPGSNIPVTSWEALDPKKNHRFIALSWNYADDMIKRLRVGGFTGTVLVPFPHFAEIIL